METGSDAKVFIWDFDIGICDLRYLIAGYPGIECKKVERKD